MPALILQAAILPAHILLALLPRPLAAADAAAYPARYVDLYRDAVAAAIDRPAAKRKPADAIAVAHAA